MESQNENARVAARAQSGVACCLASQSSRVIVSIAEARRDRRIRDIIDDAGRVFRYHPELARGLPGASSSGTGRWAEGGSRLVAR